MAARVPYGMGTPGGTRPGVQQPALPQMAPRRAPMTMAPAGGNTGQPAPVQPPPPPIQPMAGGPTSPMNIGSMLQPQQAPAPPPSPLPPWGDSGGTPGGQGQPDADAMDSLEPDKSMSPLVHLRMLKAMGRI